MKIRKDLEALATLFGISTADLRSIVGIRDGVELDSAVANGRLRELRGAWRTLEHVFPDDTAIRNWLRHPNLRLAGGAAKTPLEVLSTMGVSSFVALTGEIANGGYA